MTDRKPSPFIQTLFRSFIWIESAMIVVVAAVLLLKNSDLTSKNLVLMAGSILAGIYFLMAYQPPAVPKDENDEKAGDFKELLMLTMAPKAGWIASAITAIGLVFAYLGYQGASNMLVIGTTVLGGVLVLFVLGFVTGARRIETVMPLVYRAVPLLVVGAYVLLTLKPA